MSKNLFGYIKRLIESIAFVPALIALGFGLLPFIMMLVPHDAFKGTTFGVLRITDPESVKTILSFVIGGIFTLTIFSYTMVMNVLNRSINNYSPRLIPLLLEERHHQLILGVTSGTIIYALILAIFISTEASLNFPELATSLAILFTIVCILLFIYFIHAVSQSIHINYILKESFLNTRKNIGQLLVAHAHFKRVKEKVPRFDFPVLNQRSGYFNGLRMERLAKIARKYDFQCSIHAYRGDFILEEEAYITLSKKVSDQIQTKIKNCFNIDHDEPLEVVEVGFKHLVEVAVKASSPAINDPGTSVSSIDYLTQLFIKYLSVQPFNAYGIEDDIQFYINHIPVEELLKYCFVEMYTYMKNDPLLVEKLAQSLHKIDVSDRKNRLEMTISTLQQKLRPHEL